MDRTGDGGSTFLRPCDRLWQRVTIVTHRLWFRQVQAMLLAMVPLLLVTAAVLLVGLGLYQGQKPNAYAVFLDGERLGAVVEVSEIPEALDTLLQEVKAEVEAGDVSRANQVTWAQVRAREDEITGKVQIQELLRVRLTYVARGTAITVDGKTLAVVDSPAAAEEVFSRVKAAFFPPGAGVQAEEVTIRQEIAFQVQEAEPGQILAVERAVNAILDSDRKIEVHRVSEGESLWAIARQHNLLTDDLRQFNPQLRGDLLAIGQELKLVKIEPRVNVVATLKEVVKEPVPYPTRQQNDPNMYRGQEKVLVAGQAGEKEVTYRLIQDNGVTVKKTVLEEIVVKEPVARVVARGTRIVLASRGGGSGELIWPLRGPLTSAYGYRGREFHTGIDIGAPTGTPVAAALGGRIAYVGRVSGYGINVVIDHGDGLSTRYAHLSRANVMLGQEVATGETVGVVGTTGRTTGPHLHFEVLVNGVARNPYNYLR